MNYPTGADSSCAKQGARLNGEVLPVLSLYTTVSEPYGHVDQRLTDIKLYAEIGQSL